MFAWNTGVGPDGVKHSPPYIVRHIWLLGFFVFVHFRCSTFCISLHILFSPVCSPLVGEKAHHGQIRWSHLLSPMDWFNHQLALNISSLFLRQVLRFCNSDFQDDLEIVRQAPPKISFARVETFPWYMVGVGSWRLKTSAWKTGKLRR